MSDDWKSVAREIRRAKIREPRDDQYVDVCQWSKTGWAIWNKDGACTCQPAKRPLSLTAVVPDDEETLENKPK